MKLLAKVSAFEECENIKTILLSQKITYQIEVRNKNNMFKFVTFREFIFRRRQNERKSQDTWNCSLQGIGNINETVRKPEG